MSMIQELSIELEREVSWDEVAALAQELQDNEHVYSVSVRRTGARVAAGGPGFDIVPILVLIVVTTTFTTLVQEAVRDVLYPFLKDKLYRLYSKLPAVTTTGLVKPLAVTMKDGDLEALYRFGEGLEQEDFDEGFRAIPDHFETLRNRGETVVMLDYDAESSTWVENREAGEFLTWLRQRKDTLPPEPESQ